MAVSRRTRTPRNVARRAEPVPMLPLPPGATLVGLFTDRVKRWPDRPALRESVGGSWRSITWGEYGTAVSEAAAGLIDLGVDAGDRVGILAGNQPRWHMADVAILASAGVSVPAYPSAASSQIAYVLAHSGCRACFVGDPDQLAKLLLAHRRLPALEHIVLLGDAPDGLDDDLLVTFDDLCAIGRDRLRREPRVVEDRYEAIRPESLATIVYTSGTTGPPKGAQLTHANVTATVASITSAVPVGPTDRFLSFLPLSHIAERVVSHAGQVASGGETWFTRSLATLAEDLRACRPTIFFAVPRVWEKFRAAILDELTRAPGPVRALADRYVRLGLAHVDARDPARSHGPMRLPDLVAYLALDRTIGARIRAKLGLDQGRVFVSAAAPIDADLVRWFHAIRLPIAEVYGQTEDCGPTTMNRTGRIRVGTVGEPLPGVEVRIARDGEILVRGANVCAGYHDDPEATAELLTADRWMRTGDLGTLDSDGYLHITGRKKDLIVTSSGKNIAPQDIETRLRAQPLLSQAIVVGDRRSYLTALLALDVEAAIARIGDGDQHVELEALSSHPVVEHEIAEAVDRVNADRAPIERIKAWRILPRELTIAAGELTPTLKVKRDVVTARFGLLVEEMYARR
jgi:long-chain acyl-CoA synthetase